MKLLGNSVILPSLGLSFVRWDHSGIWSRAIVFFTAGAKFFWVLYLLFYELWCFPLWLVETGIIPGPVRMLTVGFQVVLSLIWVLGGCLACTYWLVLSWSLNAGGLCEDLWSSLWSSLLSGLLPCEFALPWLSWTASAVSWTETAGPVWVPLPCAMA